MRMRIYGKNPRRLLRIFPVFLMIFVILSITLSCSAKTSTTSSTSTISTTSSSTSSQPVSSSPAPVTIDLTAQSISFDKSSITVPAGAIVTVNFNNKDSGIPHNFAVYQNVSGGQPKAIFVGKTITGPAQTTYQFTAPAAGSNYFFECDVHPTQMNGSFIVQ